MMAISHLEINICKGRLVRAEIAEAGVAARLEVKLKRVWSLFCP